MKKVIDGARIEIDTIHMRLNLDGLPSEDELSKHQPKFHSNWFGKNMDQERFHGPPMMLDVLLTNCVFCQTDISWKASNDLKLLRKSQGDRSKDFTVFKSFQAKSFNVTLMPHPSTLKQKKNKKSKKKSKKKKKNKSQSQSQAVILLQNALLNLHFIFQRKHQDGTIKTISIETFFKKLDIFMTQNQYFDMNYFIASLLYAQAKQYEFEERLNSKLDEPSISNSYSITAQSSTKKEQSAPDLSTNKQSTETKDNDDEDKDAVESHHLSSGKLLFDALSLCQPPRFQWNVCITNIFSYFTTSIIYKSGSFTLHEITAIYKQLLRSHKKYFDINRKFQFTPQSVLESIVFLFT